MARYDPYPMLTMLSRAFGPGERGGIPVLPPAGVGWGGAPPAGSGPLDTRGQIPDPATRRGQDAIDAWRRQGGTIPPQGQPGDDCLLKLPSLYDRAGYCVISRETGTLFGVNVLLLLLLAIGGLMLLVPAVSSGVRWATGATPASHAQRAVRAALAGKKKPAE